MTRARSALAALIASTWLAHPSGAQDAESEPLAAIDWLSESLRAEPQPTASARQTPPGVRAPVPGEAPVASAVETPRVTAIPLGAANAGPVGLWPPSRAGLPETLWAGSDTGRLVDLIGALPIQISPPLQALLRDMMLVSAAPPRVGGTEMLMRARVDRLLVTGDIDEARALIDAAGSSDPELFRRDFDTALLSGREQESCARLEGSPRLAPTWPVRVFCLARSGDWAAAALTMGTARALGDISDAEEALLSRFLDPDLYEGEPDLPLPDRMTPLEFRLREAIGTPVPTGSLPLAFIASDLRPMVGWKAQIEAAERLSRGGTLPPERLLDLYRRGRPAASGGVWERVATMQALDAAFGAGPEAVGQALPPAYAAMSSAHLEPALAALWGRRLARLSLPGDAGKIAHDLALLAGIESTGTGLADAISRGDTRDLTPVGRPLPDALIAAFAGAPAPDGLMALAESDRQGEALLQAIALFEAGRQGDPASVRDALAALRGLGQDRTARAAALHLLLAEQPE